MLNEMNNHKKMNGALGVLNDKLEDFKDILHDAQLKSKKTINHFKRATEDALYDGQEKLKDAAVTVNKSVRKNPWIYIGGAAAGAFVAGLVLGIFKNKE